MSHICNIASSLQVKACRTVHLILGARSLCCKVTKRQLLVANSSLASDVAPHKRVVTWPGPGFASPHRTEGDRARAFSALFAGIRITPGAGGRSIGDAHVRD